MSRQTLLPRAGRTAMSRFSALTALALAVTAVTLSVASASPSSALRPEVSTGLGWLVTEGRRTVTAVDLATARPVLAFRFDSASLSVAGTGGDGYVLARTAAGQSIVTRLDAGRLTAARPEMLSAKGFRPNRVLAGQQTLVVDEAAGRYRPLGDSPVVNLTGTLRGVVDGEGVSWLLAPQTGLVTALGSRNTATAPSEPVCDGGVACRLTVVDGRATVVDLRAGSTRRLRLDGGQIRSERGPSVPAGESNRVAQRSTGRVLVVDTAQRTVSGGPLTGPTGLSMVVDDLAQVGDRIVLVSDGYVTVLNRGPKASAPGARAERFSLHPGGPLELISQAGAVIVNDRQSDAALVVTASAVTRVSKSSGVQTRTPGQPHTPRQQATTKVAAARPNPKPSAKATPNPTANPSANPTVSDTAAPTSLPSIPIVPLSSAGPAAPGESAKAQPGSPATEPPQNPAPQNPAPQKPVPQNPVPQNPLPQVTPTPGPARPDRQPVTPPPPTADPPAAVQPPGTPVVHLEPQVTSSTLAAQVSMDEPAGGPISALNVHLVSAAGATVLTRAATPAELAVGVHLVVPQCDRYTAQITATGPGGSTVGRSEPVLICPEPGQLSLAAMATSSTSITADFSTPDGPFTGGFLTTVEVRLPGGLVVASRTGAQGSSTFSDLHPNTRYLVVVRASDRWGRSTQAQATVLTLPGSTGVCRVVLGQPVKPIAVRHRYESCPAPGDFTLYDTASPEYGITLAVRQYRLTDSTGLVQFRLATTEPDGTPSQALGPLEPGWEDLGVLGYAARSEVPGLHTSPLVAWLADGRAAPTFWEFTTGGSTEVITFFHGRAMGTVYGPPR